MRRAVKVAAIGAAVLGTLFGSIGVASADSDTTYADSVQITVLNNTNQRVFEICNHQSSANSFKIDVIDVTAGRVAEIQDIYTGWTTYDPVVNFNAGGCEEFNIISGANGDVYRGQFSPDDGITWYVGADVGYN